MKIVWGGINDPSLNAALGNWCAAKLEMARGFRDFSSMGVFIGRDLAAVTVFHDWHPERGVIEISAASTDRRWMARNVLREMFGYTFDQLKCQTVVMRVSERNVMANGRGLPRLLKAYGFRDYFIPRLRGRDEGEVVWTLADDDWRANRFHKDM